MLINYPKFISFWGRILKNFFVNTVFKYILYKVFKPLGELCTELQQKNNFDLNKILTLLFFINLLVVFSYVFIDKIKNRK